MIGGHSHEEEYFFKQNQELIDRRRAKLDAERRAKEAEERKARHWMKCPKCGNDMEEIEMAGIMVDKCKTCLGIYFDHGEVELLLEAKQPKGFLDGMKRLFASGKTGKKRASSGAKPEGKRAATGKKKAKDA